MGNSAPSFKPRLWPKTALSSFTRSRTAIDSWAAGLPRRAPGGGHDRVRLRKLPARPAEWGAISPLYHWRGWDGQVAFGERRLLSCRSRHRHSPVIRWRHQRSQSVPVPIPRAGLYRRPPGHRDPSTPGPTTAPSQVYDLTASGNARGGTRPTVGGWIPTGSRRRTLGRESWDPGVRRHFREGGRSDDRIRKPALGREDHESHRLPS